MANAGIFFLKKNSQDGNYADRINDLELNSLRVLVQVLTYKQTQ
jgi:hypothetical protein